MAGAEEQLDVAARLAVHEAVCAERYGFVIQRLGRLERIMFSTAGALIAGQVTIIGFLLTRFLVR